MAMQKPPPSWQGPVFAGLLIIAVFITATASAARDTSRPPQITIFAGEIEAFGGAERSLLALSRWLHERKLEHRLLLYYDDIHLSFYAHHPIDIFTLNPEAHVMHKVGMLQASSAAVLFLRPVFSANCQSPSKSVHKESV